MAVKEEKAETSETLENLEVSARSSGSKKSIERNDPKVAKAF